jgi:hypothetical protein|tara:strand:+ start:169 stop:477 length:309 start_codon:yes stop_codon:yes gene_type:complete
MSPVQSDDDMLQNNHAGSTIKRKRSKQASSKEEGSKDQNDTAGAVSEFKKSSERDINPLATQELFSKSAKLSQNTKLRKSGQDKNEYYSKTLSIRSVSSLGL